MIITVILSFFVTFVCTQLTYIVVRNYIAHQFFKKKSPKLPVLPNPNIFAGHGLRVLCQNNNYLIIDELHKKYGKNFGHYLCHQPVVSTKDPELIKTILIDQARLHPDRPYLEAGLSWFEDSIAQIGGKEWLAARGAVAPHLTNHKVNSDKTTAKIKDLMDQLEKGLEHQLDVAEKETGVRSIVITAHDIAQSFSFGLLFAIGFDRNDVIDFNVKEDKWVQKNEAIRKCINPLTMVGFALPHLRPLMTFIMNFHPVGQSYKLMCDFAHKNVDINRVAQEKIQRNRLHPDDIGNSRHSASERGFFNNLAERLLDKKLSYSQYMGTIFFTMVAGYLSTADTIAILLWFIVQNPHVEAKLRRILVGQYERDEDYAVWCIKETLRMHPAAPLGASRILNKDVKTSDGTIIPKGTIVSASIYSVHRDEAIWPDADKFIPERWENFQTFHKAAFIPFGLGPRRCPGEYLVIQEIKLAIKSLLSKYRIERCEETIDELGLSNPSFVFLVADKPIRIQLTPIEKNKMS